MRMLPRYVQGLCFIIVAGGVGGGGGGLVHTICRCLQVITFIDLAGHERYLKTTVFGMTGHAPDFAMLMVCGIYILSVNE